MLKAVLSSCLPQTFLTACQLEVTLGNSSSPSPTAGSCIVQQRVLLYISITWLSDENRRGQNVVAQWQTYRIQDWYQYDFIHVTLLGPETNQFRSSSRQSWQPFKSAVSSYHLWLDMSSSPWSLFPIPISVAFLSRRHVESASRPSKYNTLYNDSSCSHVHDLNSTLPTPGCCRHGSFDQAIVSHSLSVSNGSS
jgi:hypothetical protein